jgi:NitT/TauT family transport system substrate-binding protein
MNRLIWSGRVFASLFVLITASVGTAVAAEKATLRLDWTIGGWQIPFFLALDRGYYAAEGVDLEILEGKGSSTTIQLIGRGNDTFGYVDASALPKSVAAGVPVKMVMGILKRTMMSVVVRKDGPIQTVADLKGKTITVTAGDAQSVLMPAFLNANKLPPDSVKVMAVDPGAKYRLLAEGQADGTASYGPLAGPLIEGLFKVEIRQFDFGDSGITIPGFGVIASRSTIETNPKLVQAFVTASARGWQDARKDPAAAVAAALAHFPQVKGREAEFDKTLRRIAEYIDTPNTVGKPFGWMSPDDWANTEKLMVQYLELKPAASVDAYFTNQFVK